VTTPVIRPPRRPVPNAAITRVWQPTDGAELLADILREVIAANGTLTALIPAIVLTPMDLIAAGAQAADPEQVA
jgi:hypothetical protein